MEVVQLFANGIIIFGMLRLISIAKSATDKRDEIAEQHGIRLLEIKERAEWILDSLEKRRGY